MDVKQFPFPDFVQSLPEADIPFPGLRGWVLQGVEGQVVFHESDVEVIVAEHTHSNQWGVVVDGRIEFTIAGLKQVCTQGESYVLPSGVPHAGHIYPGYRSVDFFSDPNHYRLRSGGPSQ